jgi:hypothetical protein
MENNENLEQQNVETTEKEENAVKKYDIEGLIIGAFFGVILAIVGITDILMGIVVGMFLGLVTGTCIKKK